MIAKHRKTITAVVTGLIGWATAVVTSNSTQITAAEWIMLATVLATSLGVYAVPNAADSVPAPVEPPVATPFPTDTTTTSAPPAV